MVIYWGFGVLFLWVISVEGQVVKIELIRFDRSPDDIIRSLSEFEGF